jgi:hypothetical protein
MTNSEVSLETCADDIVLVFVLLTINVINILILFHKNLLKFYDALENICVWKREKIWYITSPPFSKWSLIGLCGTALKSLMHRDLYPSIWCTNCKFWISNVRFCLDFIYTKTANMASACEVQTTWISMQWIFKSHLYYQQNMACHISAIYHYMPHSLSVRT